MYINYTNFWMKILDSVIISMKNSSSLQIFTNCRIIINSIYIKNDLSLAMKTGFPLNR